ncbi:NIAA [Symbiodinium pilosum]|uniref:NIAA protein n=1 Tax=Symbiodinium pilosum TaxID=2952 RepID=A0A812INQ5_SYMPI|nr:NIAA [Symbiodinium pilosum]
MSVSAEEVAKHNTDKDCWVIVGDQVLDVTEFLSEHPGGKKSIMMFAGKDATEEFDMLHDRKVIKKYGLDEGTVVLKGTIKNPMSVSAEEVAKHNTDKDCWVIVGDQVLDDATEEFDMLHDRKVIKKYGLDEGTVVLKGTIKK